MATKDTILKKAMRKVEKLNDYIRESIKECGGETDLYLDNSSTIEGVCNQALEYMTRHQMPVGTLTMDDPVTLLPAHESIDIII